MNETVNIKHTKLANPGHRSLHRSAQPIPALLSQEQGDKSDCNKGIQSAIEGFFKGKDKARHTQRRKGKTLYVKALPPKRFQAKFIITISHYFHAQELIL